VYPGGMTSSAAGDPADLLRSLELTPMGSVVLVRALAAPGYGGHNWAAYVNGIYTGVIVRGNASPEIPFEFVLSAPSESTKVSVLLLDVGDWVSIDLDDAPTVDVLSTLEGSNGSVLALAWGEKYTVEPVRNIAASSEEPVITLTGARRGINLGEHELSTRGRLVVEQLHFDGAYHVTLYADGRPVAFGAAQDSGGSIPAAPIALLEVDGSGLTGTYTFSAHAPDEFTLDDYAYCDVRFAKSYQIHYSTSALVFPRTAQATVLDTGGELRYAWRSLELAAGTYNYTVLYVDDEDNAQTSAIPGPYTLTIAAAAPLEPTGLAASGTAANPLISWTVGVAGCTFTVYAGEIDASINFDAGSTPTPIATAVDATSATLAAVTGYGTKTRNPSALFTDVGAHVSTILAAYYQQSSATLLAAWGPEFVAIRAHIAAYCSTAGIDGSSFLDTFDEKHSDILSAIDLIDSEQSYLEFRRTFEPLLLDLLRWLGDAIDSAPGFWDDLQQMQLVAVNGTEIATEDDFVEDA
jgi:hypothetical protein